MQNRSILILLHPAVAVCLYINRTIRNGPCFASICSFPELSQQWDKPTLIPWSIRGRRMWSASEQPQHKVHIMPPERTTLTKSSCITAWIEENHTGTNIKPNIFTRKNSSPVQHFYATIEYHPHTYPNKTTDARRLQQAPVSNEDLSHPKPLCQKSEISKRKHSRDLSS